MSTKIDKSRGKNKNPEIQDAKAAKGKKEAGEEDIKKVSFPDLSDKTGTKGNNSIGMLNDIPLKVVVELGRTVLKIKDVLELGVGSIVELDKLSGEPVDILINGERIARGEVVVIDEDFGVRITDVILDKENKEENGKTEEN